MLGRELRFARLWPMTRPFEYNLRPEGQPKSIHTIHFPSSPIHRIHSVKLFQTILHSEQIRIRLALCFPCLEVVEVGRCWWVEDVGVTEVTAKPENAGG